jgi:hypothetical protein
MGTILLLFPLVAIGLGACAGPQATASAIEISLSVDGQARQLEVPSGSTVQGALDVAGVELANLDRTDPPAYTVLTDRSSIDVTRVKERFEIESVVLPFERQTVLNEGLPAGDTRLLQPGENGLQEITYRIVEEAGAEISRTPVKSTIVLPSQPEIVMVGSQASFTPVSIPGTIAYMAAGNAWLIEDNTGSRRPVLVEGDLDGRVFDLSADGDWLLYTRSSESEGELNSLFALFLEDPDTVPISLGADNIVHFAEWSPDTTNLQLAYSTAEPSPAAPGWQANNDLVLVTLSRSGRILDREILVPANAGGQYGWWGTDFVWAPDGIHLAFARADAVGVLDIRDPEPETLADITPFQTLGDWAWVPGLDWGQDSRTLYYVDHGEPTGLEDPVASPVFHLGARPAQGGGTLNLSQRTGMFALPSVSPPQVHPSGEIAYGISFFRADSPLESQDSAYRLWVADRDGSNAHGLFPTEGDPGLRGDDLQQSAIWSPDGRLLATIYRGNLWLVELSSGRAQQITGDGQTSVFDWSN